jgi:primosomal protein N' (replication factor Y)
MHSKFARVIIDRAIRRELDYAVPESLSARVGVGTRVRVPFRDRRALATVVALLEETKAKGVREIEAVIGEGPTLSEPLLELARWIANYYCCPIEAVMRSLLPQVIRRGGSWLEKAAVHRDRVNCNRRDDGGVAASCPATGGTAGGV